MGREFKTLSPYSQELFAPASTLAAVHAFMLVSMSLGLEICTFDFKDAYLQVDQPVPMTIEVSASMFGEGQQGMVTLVLDKLLPGQRIGASAWYNFAKELLEKGNYENFQKEPTLFKNTVKGSQAGLILHADDGLLASTAAEREALQKLLGEKVKVEFSSPMVAAGDELQFLKRKYIMHDEASRCFRTAGTWKPCSRRLAQRQRCEMHPQTARFSNPTTARNSGRRRPMTTARRWAASSTCRTPGLTSSSRCVF